MTTKLSNPLRREIVIEDKPYKVTLDTLGLKLVEKGRRKGLEISWKDLISGDEGMARALQASVNDRREAA